MVDLKVGQIYRRSALHDAYGGQRQGGISTPSQYPVIFIFTGDSGEQYGYRDGFQEDGTFWYTGEGQAGDMQFVRGNKAIRDSDSDGREIHLFESAERTLVRYVGACTYIDHHFAVGPDLNDDERKVIVFELAMVGSGDHEIVDAPETKDAGAPNKMWRKSLDQLRSAAITAVPATATKQQKLVNTYVRITAVKVYVLKRANGKCEGCGAEAPFVTKEGRPYLEPHHLRRLADGGPDHPAHVAALCPNCHRRVHYGRGGEEYNREIEGSVRELEASYVG